MSAQEQRSAKRFDLRLPFELLRSGALAIHHRTETKDLSSSGVKFSSESQLPVGDAIEYLITLPGNNRDGSAVRLRCLGTVVRLEPNHRRSQKDRPFDIAATLERYEFVRHD
jgi:PilZ domain